MSQDLVVAALQQLQLLLGCPAAELVQTSISHMPKPQEGTSSSSSGVDASAALLLLDATNMMCAAAVHQVVTASRCVAYGAQPEASSSSSGASECGWLALQWRCEFGSSGSSSTPGRHAPDLKRLLAAATACDQHVKHALRSAGEGPDTV